MKQIERAKAWLLNSEAPLNPPRYLLLLIYRMVGRFMEGELKERAQSLTYTTLLSLVPLIAISFSVLKGFGVHRSLEPLLYDAVGFLGEDRANEFVSVLIGLVDNVQGVVLGGAGLLVLFYTVVGLISTIERAFNKIWGVVKGRNLQTRFVNYLLVVLMGPVFIFAITSIFSGALMDKLMLISPHPVISFLVSKALTISIVTILIWVIYLFIPHSKVRVIPAFLGALIAANFWYIVGKLFTLFVVNSGKQAIIYSGFASIVLFIMWLYLSWLILLVGNQLVFFFQNPEALLDSGEPLHRVDKMEITISLEPQDEQCKNWHITHIKTDHAVIDGCRVEIDECSDTLVDEKAGELKMGEKERSHG
ncbi:MAG: YihY/virulence factor BrkB family protein, partial [Xanthomonadaceae bacterium]|nr:YihY/virulence factor BrkB family protein [Xanthomonadaceae bacterium]